MSARNRGGGKKRDVGKRPAPGGPGKKQNMRNPPARDGRDSKQQESGNTGHGTQRSAQVRAGAEAVYQAVLAIIFLATLIAALAVIDNSWVRGGLGLVAL